MNGALLGGAATSSSLWTGTGWWGKVRAGDEVGTEPEVDRTAGRTASEGKRGAARTGRGVALALSPLSLLVPGQVDRRVAADADACQV